MLWLKKYLKVVLSGGGKLEKVKQNKKAIRECCLLFFIKPVLGF
ncbi:hypothetical protein FM107_17220 [Sphingobacterium sp. JB170]|nr:hypothetical protein FM107_17220 [Sphingobacterium sp. JB170]